MAAAPSRWIALLIVVSLLATGLGFGVAWFIRSPHEEAITNANTAITATAAVEEREFTEAAQTVPAIISRGTAQKVIPSGNESAVVTSVNVDQGVRVGAGMVLGNVSGRPVILLHLAFPLYRDVMPGDSGDDVAAIQRALQELGLYSAAIDGEYGPTTQAAIAKLYKARGLRAPTEEVSEEPQEHSPPQTDEPVATEPQATVPRTPPRPIIKKAEVAMLAAPEATVETISSVGASINEENPLATLRYGATIANARIAVSQQQAFSLGDAVTVSADGNSFEGKIDAISEFKEAGGERHNSIPGYDLTVTLTNADSLADGSQAEVIQKETDQQTRSGLAVPITAIREENGQSFVLSHPESTRINVSIERVSDGWALVTGDRIKTGMNVVVTE